MQLRIPVVDKDGKPLMPTKPARARQWIESGKALKRWSDVGLFYVQLTIEPSGRDSQAVVIGIDPGKRYSGIAVQSRLFTLYTAHLELPFKLVKDRMDFRRVMRKARRRRRVDRSKSFELRSHRQKRVNNRRQLKVPPSIKANRQLELRVVKELCKVFPVSKIVFEYVKARTKKGCSFSPVMVGQKWAIGQLTKLAPVKTLFGHETAAIRRHLDLVKTKNKAKRSIESHAVDGIALASSEFVAYTAYHRVNEDGKIWIGSVSVTASVFKIVQRPTFSRRQLHLANFLKGHKRRKYGGTTTPFYFRKGDLVACRNLIGYCSGHTGRSISISDQNWKRLGRFSIRKIKLISRNIGLLVSHA